MNNKTDMGEPMNDDKNVLDFEALEVTVNADADAASKSGLDALERLEAELVAEEPKLTRIDAVAVPLSLEPIVLTAPKSEAVVEVAKELGIPVDPVETDAGDSLIAAAIEEVESRTGAKPYTPRSHKRVVFNVGTALTAILSLRPTTVNASAQICLEQLAPEQKATAYGKSKKILAQLAFDRTLEVNGRTINWLK